jgi:hypothetical protein
MSNSAKVGLGRVLINAQIRFSHPGFPPRPDVLASATWATDRHIYVGKAFEYHRVSRKTRRDRSFFHRARDHDLTHVAFSELLGTKLQQIRGASVPAKSARTGCEVCHIDVFHSIDENFTMSLPKLTGNLFRAGRALAGLNVT